jgi:hypothetical protein
MSKSNNVNPDHYKVAGRERPGKAVAKTSKEPASGIEKTRAAKWRERQQTVEKEQIRGKR